MQITVMGAGAMGGYFGARLAAAGHEVTLVARGAHLAALQEHGLRLHSPKGDLHLPGLRAVGDVGAAGQADVILFTVKNGDLEAAAASLKPTLREETMVVTCQNGVSAPDRLAGIIGKPHVVPGVARLPGDIEAPGVIRHSAPFDMLSFGEADGGQSPRCDAFAAALEEAGCMVQQPGNIRHDLWAKFVMQASFASVTALTRLDIGPLRESAESAGLIRESMAETEAVGRAVLPDLPQGLADTAWGLLSEKLPPTTHASMLDDLNRGKPIETAYLSGDVVRLGAKHGVATPIHATFARLLAPYAAGPPA
ncbi:ketopantoate reductase family protein [Alterinioella nitratireducens]|uniref:ketopantoate reductase family protein n=1 Tax=Alterinioella nitratireducens TaxID=2735915 RepID=UPI004059B813